MNIVRKWINIDISGINISIMQAPRDINSNAICNVLLIVSMITLSYKFSSKFRHQLKVFSINVLYHNVIAQNILLAVVEGYR
jgi:hypothetical protein